MTEEVVSLDKFRAGKRLAYRARVAKMTKLELMGEFMSVMNASAGKEWTLEEAQDCQFLMEKLLAVSESEQFRVQLQMSLKTLKQEIGRLRN